MRTKYVEPSGYFNAEMKKAFSEKKTAKKKATSKPKKTTKKK